MLVIGAIDIEQVLDYTVLARSGVVGASLQQLTGSRYLISEKRDVIWCYTVRVDFRNLE